MTFLNCDGFARHRHQHQHKGHLASRPSFNSVINVAHRCQNISIKRNAKEIPVVATSIGGAVCSVHCNPRWSGGRSGRFAACTAPTLKSFNPSKNGNFNYVLRWSWIVVPAGMSVCDRQSDREFWNCFPPSTAVFVLQLYNKFRRLINYNFVFGCNTKFKRSISL